MVAKKVARRQPVKRGSKARTPKRRTTTKKRAVAQKKTVFDAKAESQRISHYLRALESQKKGRGPKRNPAVMERRIVALQDYIKESSGLRRLQAVQRLRDTQREQAEVADAGNFEKYEKDFIASAKSYSENSGIEYGAWREVGVPAATLKAAGISLRRSR